MSASEDELHELFGSDVGSEDEKTEMGRPRGPGLTLAGAMPVPDKLRGTVDVALLRLPQSLRAEPARFRPETCTDTAGLALRWRETVDEDGNLARESNARLVTWSDGSRQVVVGEETFDVAETELQTHNCTHGVFMDARTQPGAIVLVATPTRKLLANPSSLEASARKLKERMQQLKQQQKRTKRTAYKYDKKKEQELLREIRDTEMRERAQRRMDDMAAEYDTTAMARYFDEDSSSSDAIEQRPVYREDVVNASLMQAKESDTLRKGEVRRRRAEDQVEVSDASDVSEEDDEDMVVTAHKRRRRVLEDE